MVLILVIVGAIALALLLGALFGTNRASSRRQPFQTANPAPDAPSINDANLVVFEYVDADGVISRRRVERVTATPEYLTGFDLDRGETRTFRRDRILEVISAPAEVPFSENPPPRPTRSKRTPVVTGPKILFTGFPAARRAVLEVTALNAGFQLSSNVTGRLDYLCFGPNAGPAKVARAAEVGAEMLDEAAFEALIAARAAASE